MLRRRILAILALPFTLALAPISAHAASWHRGSATIVRRAGDDPAVAALAHVRARSSELKLDGVELTNGRLIGGLRSSTVHFHRSVDGVPVLGGGVVVQFAPDGRVLRVAVDVGEPMTVDTHPTLDEDEALDALSSALGQALPPPESAQLTILRGGGGLLAWQLDIRDSLRGARYWVDARDGRIVGRRPLGFDALGRVYEESSLATPDPVDVELPLLDPQEPPGHLDGWGGLLTVTDYVSGNMGGNIVVQQTLVPSAGEDFLYAPPDDPLDPHDAIAQVNLYYHLTNIRALYESLGAEVNDPAWKLTAVANLLDHGGPLDNSFFTPGAVSGPLGAPNAILMGQGTETDFSYDSDLVKHEFGHYAAFNHVGYNLGQFHADELGISPFSGAIDEGISDYFACSDNDDPQLGEGALAALDSVRDLSDTSTYCPYWMNGEVHSDGQIIGSFAWSLREELGKDVGDRLVWAAISALLPGASFDDFVQSVRGAAADLVESGDLQDADLATIEGLIAHRGLDDCGRVIALEPDHEELVTMWGLEYLGFQVDSTCAQLKSLGIEYPSLFHFSWQPQPEDGGVRLDLNMQLSGAGTNDYTLYARANAPVAFQVAENGFPAVSAFDFSLTSAEEDASLVIDANSDPPFDPSAKYDFIVVSRSCQFVFATFSAKSVAAPPPPSEGGGGAGGGADGGSAQGGEGGHGGGEPADDEGDGCGCRAAGADPHRRDPVPWVAIGAAGMIALLGARRRRPRA